MRAEVERRLPVAGLCALAVAGFVTILTEALPAGLLPQIASSLGVSEAMAGHSPASVCSSQRPPY
jgi:predicted MFS family arabinose efflux permease